jgi:hypothetical protein
MAVNDAAILFLDLGGGEKRFLLRRAGGSILFVQNWVLDLGRSRRDALGRTHWLAVGRDGGRHG